MEINKERLWERQHQLGKLGADPSGGISRFPWTKEYKEAVELLKVWMESVGMTVRNDTVGNLFGRYEGKENVPAVLVGSHLDTVPQGGYFDGLTGIMAALESVTTLYEHGERLRHPIEIVAFINEEGNEFLGGCFGSKAIAGQLPDDYAKTCFNRRNGKTMYDSMLEFDMGLAPDNIKGSRVRQEDYCCFIETHIEQGRYLLDNGYPLAVVDTIAGIRQFFITLQGVSCHAGGMAMEERHDALVAGARIAVKLEELCLASSTQARGTVGSIIAEPGEHNIVAGKCTVAIDIREAEDKTFEKIYEALITYTKKICAERGLSFSISTTLEERPVHCSEKLKTIIDECMSKENIRHTHMVSFPSHDAQQIAKIMPVGMIFIRSSNGGCSHCPEEYTTQDDLAEGAEVLYQSLRKIASMEENEF